MKMQIVLINDDVAEEVQLDDLVGYIAARLLVQNGKRIAFVSSSEPSVPGLDCIGLEDWDCKEMSLLGSINEPPSAKEDVQYLFTGVGRRVSETVETLEHIAEHIQGRLTVVWIVTKLSVALVEKSLPRIEGWRDTELDVTRVSWELPETIVFEPSIGVRFEVARSGLAKSLLVVLKDLEDLDRTHDH